MHRFVSLYEAQAFVRDVVDRPILSSTELISDGVQLTSTTVDMGAGRFTNSYDLAFDGTVQPEVIAFDNLTSVYEFISRAEPRPYTAATGGGFFYLADHASSSPRQLALNLSISRGNLRSLPVVDRESVIVGPRGLEVHHLAALGSLTLNGHELDWSGSLTAYDTAIKLYSNGNAAIDHQEHEATGSHRVLNEKSRYTPIISGDDFVDVGFVGRGGGSFISADSNVLGGVDIFAHDFVLRCPQRYVESTSEVEIHSIGGMALSQFKGGAFSAGPLLNAETFHDHPINYDLSLGSRPPFADVYLARTALYRTDDGLTHIRLFDGRPGSLDFTGVTPTEAVSQITSDTEGQVEWGCFLDPGQTAKLCVNYPEHIESYGNQHYLRWPTGINPDFLWAPKIGRPVANMIAL
jgi:hypothetical protein